MVSSAVERGRRGEDDRQPETRSLESGRTLDLAADDLARLAGRDVDPPAGAEVDLYVVGVDDLAIDWERRKEGGREGGSVSPA